MDKVKIIDKIGPGELVLIKELFLDYAASLDFNLKFQSFSEELNTLPGKYSHPEGKLLLALCGNEPAGCVAMRKLEPGISEMKRLYVRPEFRGLHVGKKLAKRIIKEAVNSGYRKMRLDTIKTMTEARMLYKSLGFKEIEPYCFNPVEGAVFMELEL